MNLIRSLPGRDWVEWGACRGADPNLFFADEFTPYNPEARAMCATCPVTNSCLAWAIASHEEHGMWGGQTPRQRRELRRYHKERVVAAAAAEMEALRGSGVPVAVAG